MGKRTSRFSDRDIQRFKPTEKTYLESEPDGLYVRILPSGRKSFMTVYSFEGKQRWLTIGRYPDISLSKARMKVKEIREKVENEIDPSLAQQQARAAHINAPTVAEFAEEYLKKWARPKKKSAAEDERCLNKNVIPIIGRRKMKDVTRTEIINLIDDIAERAPIMANRTLALIRKMFNFSLNRGVIEFSPCLGIIPPGKENKKNRFLSEQEIKTVWPIMAEVLTDQTNRAIKMGLATAQRPGEVASMHWDEVDGEWWTIPEEKTKNGTEHRVFLNKIALELIGEPKKKGFVFPSQNRANQPIHQKSFSHALRKKMGQFKDVEYFTAHDLRRTAATHMAELGHGIYVGKVLNHTDQKITAVYDRYAYDREKMSALSAWGRKLEGLIRPKAKSSKVVNIRN